MHAKTLYSRFINTKIDFIKQTEPNSEQNGVHERALWKSSICTKYDLLGQSTDEWSTHGYLGLNIEIVTTVGASVPLI